MPNTNLAETVVGSDTQSLTRFNGAEAVMSSHRERPLPPETFDKLNHTIQMFDC